MINFYHIIFHPTTIFQAKEQDLVIPAHKVETGDEYEGATVIEPVKGCVYSFHTGELSHQKEMVEPLSATNCISPVIGGKHLISQEEKLF